MKIGTEFYDPSGREIAASLIKMSVLIKFYLFWAAGAGALAVAVRNNGDLNGSSWEFPSAILSRHPESLKTLPHSVTHWLTEFWSKARISAPFRVLFSSLTFV